MNSSHFSSRSILLTMVLCAASLVFTSVKSGPAHVRAAGSSAAASQRFSPQLQQQLKATLVKNLRTANVSGGVAAIWIPGKGRWQMAAGMADAATGRLMSISDPMRVGSITKSMVNTAILQLMDQGKLSLDDPISKYVSGVPNGQNITLRLLGNMRSGLFSYTQDEAWGKLFNENPYKQWTPEQLLSYSFNKPSYFKPNGGFHYSNTNLILLGLVVEKVSGQTAAHYLEQHIFKPLGMNHTVLPTNAAIPTPYAHGFTAQTLSGKVADSTHWNPSGAWTAGAVITTIGDLAIWANAVGTGALLSPRAQRERLTFVPVGAGLPGGYGLGVGTKNGWILHDGQIPGYSSFLGYLPALHAVLVVSVTSDISYKKQAPGNMVANALSQVAMPNHSLTGNGTGNG
jgi:D-alanyl-D-alanine carboxypeptidase